MNNLRINFQALIALLLLVAIQIYAQTAAPTPAPTNYIHDTLSIVLVSVFCGLAVIALCCAYYWCCTSSSKKPGYSRVPSSQGWYCLFRLSLYSYFGHQIYYIIRRCTTQALAPMTLLPNAPCSQIIDCASVTLLFTV
jgi:hypothetical protein